MHGPRINIVLCLSWSIIEAETHYYQLQKLRFVLIILLGFMSMNLNMQIKHIGFFFSAIYSHKTNTFGRERIKKKKRRKRKKKITLVLRLFMLQVKIKCMIVDGN